MSIRNRYIGPAGRRVDSTRAAVGLVFRRRDSLSVAGSITLGYLAAFLWAAQDLSLRTDVPPNLVVARDPLGLLFQRTGPASFEAIALLDTGVFRLLISPGNIALGLLIAILVGISLSLTYLAVMQPKACGIGAGSGFFASLPALLSGTVCCGPVILIALGIQASGLLLTAFFWLLPVGILLLLGSIVYVAGKIDVQSPTVRGRDPTGEGH